MYIQYSINLINRRMFCAATSHFFLLRYKSVNASTNSMYIIPVKLSFKMYQSRCYYLDSSSSL